MRTRRLVPADAPAYRALMLAAYAQHPDAFTSMVAERAALPLAWWAARFSTHPQPPSIVLGVFEDEALVAVTGLSFESRPKTRHKAKLFGMYVSPAFRQRGLGRKLVEAVLAEARARDGVRLVQLTFTHRNTAARSLYEGCGFVEFGLEPYALAMDEGFASLVHMWCDLDAGPGDA